MPKNHYQLLCNALRIFFLEAISTGIGILPYDNFTVADAYLGVFVRWLAKFGDEFDDLQQVRRYRDAYESRPSVIAALQFESANG